MEPRVLVFGGRSGAAVDDATGAHSPEVAAALAAEGLVLERVSEGDAVWAAIGTQRPALVLIELRPGEPGGVSLMERLHRQWPQIPVLLLTPRPLVAEAVRVMQAGAAWYGPAEPSPDLLRAVRRALESAWAKVSAGKERLLHFGARNGIVGSSAAIRHVLRQSALAAPTRTTVLLLGETGTGKERLAQAIHEASPRHSGPFVAVNCAALADALLESELYGHEKGAFTGAHARREGRFKMADSGTIFLDEIGEISLGAQVKLLRVLQERSFERVGGNQTLSVDVRVIAATNRNLREMVEQKSFRADLFYRLSVMAIEVPPLRDRRGDIPALVERLLPRLATDLGLPEAVVAPEALQALVDFDWPGNVRELENVLQRALILAQGGLITNLDLPPSAAAATPMAPGGPPVPGATFREIERYAIMTTYHACGRSPLRTAEILGISPRTVHYRLREYRGERGRRLQSPQDQNGHDDTTETGHPAPGNGQRVTS